MNHPDKYKARRYDTTGRSRAFTDAVYREVKEDAAPLLAAMKAAERSLDPEPPALTALYGEVHGHTCLSDGRPDVDSYFTGIRDVAGLDFAALSDHDHGGVGKPTLYAGDSPKWDIIKDAVARYNEKGRFTTILAYERDSYPFFNNMVIYFRDGDADMVIGRHPGELCEDELRALLARDDLVFAPHDPYSFTAGTDFLALDKELMPPLLEIISRGDASEYMGNPANDRAWFCEGGSYQDALRSGAKIGVIAGSDDHGGNNGRVVESVGYPAMYPGVTGVWARENSREAIFEALKARRTFAFMLGLPEGEMGGRMEIDFRINGHYMGESIKRNEKGELEIYFNVKSDVPIKEITVVKNCRNYILFRYARELFLDYRQENEVDYYYLRVELKDGRFGWSSPIWVER